MPVIKHNIEGIKKIKTANTKPQNIDSYPPSGPPPIRIIIKKPKSIELMIIKGILITMSFFPEIGFTSNLSISEIFFTSIYLI